MKCIKCGFEVANNSSFCANCGTNLNFQSQNPINNHNYNYNIPMKFHFVFCILLFIAAFTNAIEVIMSITEIGSLSIIALFLCPFNIITGIFLLKRKKAGNIMRLISNIIGIITPLITLGTSAFLFVVAMLFKAIADELSATLGEIFLRLTEVGLMLFIPIFILIIAIISINIISIIYYRKRKHMFN